MDNFKSSSQSCEETVQTPGGTVWKLAQSTSSIVTEVEKLPQTAQCDSPIWLNLKKALIYTDKSGKYVYCYHSDRGYCETMKFDKLVGFAIPTNETKEGDIFLAVGLEDQIVEANFSKKTIMRVLVRRSPTVVEMRFVGGKCTSDGTLFSWCAPNEQGKRGNVYMLNKKLELEQPLSSTQIHQPNGCALSKGNNFYLVDSSVGIYSWKMIDRLGRKALITRKVAYSLSAQSITAGHFLGGMTIDEEDMLWVVICGPGLLIRIDPSTEEEIYRIELPCKNPTDCSFGGENLDEIYITCTERENGETGRGKLFRIFVPWLKGTDTVLMDVPVFTRLKFSRKY